MTAFDQWTLFLDRDGVINKRLPGNYVQKWDEFEFLPGVLEALKKLSRLISRIIIVTNQRGLALGLMNQHDLELIHQKMLDEIENHGGKIQAIFYCGLDYHDKNNCRKPLPAMALEAQKEFPDIDFEKSFMLGDQYSDIEFGQNLNMKTVWIPENENMSWKFEDIQPNYICSSLVDFHILLKEMMHAKKIQD